MPVWHELTREARASGELLVLGITQEQHPERCELYAQWQGLDWPILWDPFNLTGTKVVPNAIAIDEFGVVRMVGARTNRFMSEFMEQDFKQPKGQSKGLPDICAYGDSHDQALGPVEWGMRGQHSKAIDAFEEALAQDPGQARNLFRAGVARRMRYDSPQHQPDDFQLALDHWTQALALDPNQYIWRRRIQQYGPRMDKPYPFYTWIAKAYQDLTERGLVPIELGAALTQAELAEPRRLSLTEASHGPLEPDPKGLIRRDERGLIALESAVAFDTSKGGAVASVHLAFRPSSLAQAHWNHEAGVALEIWLQAPGGWTLANPNLRSAAHPEAPTSTEVIRLSAEVTLPKSADEGLLRGYALYYVCEGVDGTCLYLRQDFELNLLRP